MQGRWAVFCVQANKELLALQNLSNQNFDVYLPMQAVTVRHARRQIVRKKPFFPGYGFVWIDAETRWRSVNGTIGVKYLICRNEAPAFLPDDFVSGLRDVLNPLIGVNLANRFSEGDRVQITTGPFAGLIGDLIKRDAGGRVTILLSMLSGTVPVKVDEANLTFA